MGKKAKRKRRHRNYGRPTPAHNRHHICYQRRKWNKGAPKLLRNHWYMIIDININLHNRIHYEVRSVSVPSDEVALTVYGMLQELAESGKISSSDSLEKRLKTVIQLFRDLDEKVAHDLEQQLCAI